MNQVHPIQKTLVGLTQMTRPNHPSVQAPQAVGVALAFTSHQDQTQRTSQAQIILWTESKGIPQTSKDPILEPPPLENQIL